ASAARRRTRVRGAYSRIALPFDVPRAPEPTGEEHGCRGIARHCAVRRIPGKVERQAGHGDPGQEPQI
ncbi:MAG: hypothetical protein WBV96_08065, partial [Polyangia bacterium]